MVSGLQRRHEVAYQETIAQVQRGQIGEPLTLRVYWNGGGVPAKPRLPQQTELEYQLRNWYFFTWLSGDHIVEQHVHNLDVGNWLLDEVPLEVNGQGGREVRRRSGEQGRDFGQIYDHFFCEFVYRSGTRMFSQCRQIRDCWNVVGEHVQGSRGRADISGGKIYDAGGELIWQTHASRAGQQQEAAGPVRRSEKWLRSERRRLRGAGDADRHPRPPGRLLRPVRDVGGGVRVRCSWASPDSLTSLADPAPTHRTPR